MQRGKGAEMGYSQYADLPASFSDFVLAHVAAKVSDFTDTKIWSGAGGAGSFSGFATLLAADAALPAGQEIAAVGGGVNAANVIAQMGSVVDAIPTTVYGKDDLRLYVSSNTLVSKMV